MADVTQREPTWSWLWPFNQSGQAPSAPQPSVAPDQPTTATKDSQSPASAATASIDDADFDPIVLARGASVRIAEILKFKWHGRGRGRPYVSENVARILKIAAGLARAETQSGSIAQVRARHLLRAQIAFALSDQTDGYSATLRRVDSEARLFSRIQQTAGGKNDLAAVELPPAEPDQDLLHWECISILSKASELRRATNSRYRDIGQRHIFVAWLLTKEGQTSLRDAGGFTSGYEKLRSAVIACCEPAKFADFGDRKKAWDKIIAELRDAPLLIDPVERRPDYLSDRVRPARADMTKAEPLGAAEDARALADLILLEAAEPPIAIGVFGPWGSGKSTLIEHLKAEIHRQTRAEREAREARGGGDSETRIVANVVQLSFNAWTFADSANLWATLTSEIFDQLAAGGWTGSDKDGVDSADSDPQTRNAATALVSEVAARTAREVASLRIAGVTVQEKNRAIEAAEDVLQKAQADKRASFASAIVAAAGDLAGEDGKFEGKEDLFHLLQWTFARSWRRPAVIALAGLAIVLAVLWATPAIRPFWAESFFAFTSAAAAAGALAWPVIHALLAVFRRWNERKGAADEAIARATADLRQRTVERERAEHEKNRAESFLATYNIKPSGSLATSPMQMLDYLLRESESIAAVRAQTGLLATVRRCFEQLEAVIADWKRSKDRQAIDRIVLYLDDLDRCSTRQVSDILQAVHLLLSFDCFVVVVAADANWLKHSLEHEHPQLFGSKDVTLTPADYLEKIFQVPFWVRPLVDTDAPPLARYRLYESYVDHLLRDDEPKASIPGPDTDRPPTPEKPPAGKNDLGVLESFARQPPSRSEDPYEPRRERIRLTQPEKNILKQLGPLSAKSPRAVKRMINIYRLMRVRLEDSQLKPFLGPGTDDTPSYRAVLFALACEVGLPPTTMSAAAKELSQMKQPDWKRLSGTNTAIPPAKRLADVNKPLHDALAEAQRVDDFMLALAAMEGIPDARQIHMGLEEVRRYSFRPL